MSNAIYPGNLRGLTFTVVKNAAFSTLVESSAGSVENRLYQTNNPIWKWTLAYDVLGNNSRWIAGGESYPDFQRLLGFFLARQGKFDSFLFDDPDDDFIGPALLPDLSPNLQAQLQVVNDGAGNYYSPVQRSMGGEFYEDITDLNGGISVFANGVAQVGGGTDYTLAGPGLAIPGYSFAGMYLSWVAGAPTGPVTAQANYYFRVRFDMDGQDFEKFTYNLWCIGGAEAQSSSNISLITARTTTL
jgi:hypothetical protein